MKKWLIFLFLKQNPDAFAYAYEKRGTLLGGTQLRYNFYPMITDITKVKPGQIRCGEHTDYGGLHYWFKMKLVDWRLECYDAFNP